MTAAGRGGRSRPPLDDLLILPARVPLRWHPRDPPLSPSAVLTTGRDAATRLRERLLARDDAALARLAAVAGDTLLVVLGAAEDLPWVDGVAYAGRDPAAPELYVPTALVPDLDLSLVVEAVKRLVPGAAPPVLFLPPGAGGIVASLAPARPLSRAVLHAWSPSS